MDHALQIELTRSLLSHLDAGTTDRARTISRNPVANYTCPARLRDEIQTLFKKRPLLMGLSCQIPNSGDYLTEENGTAPLLIVRGDDGMVRVFMNVCRHRGARVATGCGDGKRRFACPYHGWTYDNAGHLAGIPDEASFPGIDKSTSGLVRVPAIERDGMIWATATPPAASTAGCSSYDIDIEAYLQGLGPELRSFALGSYHHYETRVLHQQLNWKLVVDTFLEPYHFGVLHRNTVAPLFFSNLCLFHPFGPHLRETLPRRSIEQLRNHPEREWDLIRHSAVVYVLFPNTVFIMQGDHVETWRVYPSPDHPDRCTMYLDFFIPEPAVSDSAKRHWDNNVDLTVRTVVEEDFPTSEGMQSGFLSGAQTHIVYGQNEPALAYFERTVTSAVS